MTASFNPRAPCGARRDMAVANRQHRHVSIHAPRVGRDMNAAAGMDAQNSFNPRAPCGARQQISYLINDDDMFQSTRPVWGATSAITARWRARTFQSTRPVWGATGSLANKCNIRCFNPRAPCGARPP